MGKSMARSWAADRPLDSLPWNRPQSIRMPGGLEAGVSENLSSWQEPVTPSTAPWWIISIM